MGVVASDFFGRLSGKKEREKDDESQAVGKGVG